MIFFIKPSFLQSPLKRLFLKDDLPTHSKKGVTLQRATKRDFEKDFKQILRRLCTVRLFSLNPTKYFSSPRMQTSPRFTFDLNDLSDLILRIGIYLTPIALANENGIAAYLSSHTVSPVAIGIVFSILADFAQRFCRTATPVSSPTPSSQPTI